MTKVKKLNIDDKVEKLIFIFVVLFAVMALTKGNQILKPTVFQTIARQVSEIGLMALGCSICMISGGIDLSGAYAKNKWKYICRNALRYSHRSYLWCI